MNLKSYHIALLLDLYHKIKENEKMLKIKRRAPSVENLVKTFKVDKNTAIFIRQTIHTASTAEKALRAIAESKSLFHHGFEYILVNPFAYPVDSKKNLLGSYLNMGDAYNATLIARNNQVFIGCWGDIVERHGSKERNR